jgi:hypothetical protein
MMGSWIGITLIKVGGASACGGLEAEGQEYFALCLSEVTLKRSAPEPKYHLSALQRFPGLNFDRRLPISLERTLKNFWEPLLVKRNGRKSRV